MKRSCQLAPSATDMVLEEADSCLGKVRSQLQFLSTLPASKGLIVWGQGFISTCSSSPLTSVRVHSAAPIGRNSVKTPVTTSHHVPGPPLHSEPYISYRRWSWWQHAGRLIWEAHLGSAIHQGRWDNKDSGCQGVLRGDYCITCWTRRRQRIWISGNPGHWYEFATVRQGYRTILQAPDGMRGDN